MAMEISAHYSLLDDLDARQDKLLEQIDQLNTRLELLLTQFSAPSASCACVPPPQMADAGAVLQAPLA